MKAQNDAVFNAIQTLQLQFEEFKNKNNSTT